MRELIVMADGRRREAWQHTSHLLCILANVHRDPKRRACQPDEFDPFARVTATPVKLKPSQLAARCGLKPPD